MGKHCSHNCFHVLTALTDMLFIRLSAGLFRQATYSTVRLGVYQSLFDKLSRLIVLASHFVVNLYEAMNIIIVSIVPMANLQGSS